MAQVPVVDRLLIVSEGWESGEVRLRALDRTDRPAHGGGAVLRVRRFQRSLDLDVEDAGAGGSHGARLAVLDPGARALSGRLGHGWGDRGPGGLHDESEGAIAALVEAAAEDVEPLFGVRARDAEAVRQQLADVRRRVAAQQKQHQPGCDHWPAVCDDEPRPGPHGARFYD